MAVLSLAEVAPASLQQHYTWGVLLAAFGSGKWTLVAWWVGAFKSKNM